jgi:hypothetical protein
MDKYGDFDQLITIDDEMEANTIYTTMTFDYTLIKENIYHRDLSMNFGKEYNYDGSHSIGQLSGEFIHGNAVKESLTGYQFGLFDIGDLIQVYKESGVLQ